LLKRERRKKKMHLNKAVSLLLVLLLSLSMMAFLPAFAVSEVQIKAVASVTQLGDPVLKTNVIGTTFDVAIYVEDTVPATDMDLYGFDIQFNWTTEYIHYTGYTVTVPVEDYPAVQAPSPYAGILHADTMKLKEKVDEADSIPSAEPGTMAWIAYSSAAPAPSFNGSGGTICVFHFIVDDQPFCNEENATFTIHFIKTDLASTSGPVLHDAIDLEIPLWCREFVYPPSPMLKISPDDIVAPNDCVCKNFTIDIYLLGEDGGDLDSFWDVAGCDFYVNFNASMIEAVEVEIDPDGDFGFFWADGTFELVKDIDNTAGWVHVAFVGLGETHDPVEGTIRVATVKFHMIYEHTGYPPPSSAIYLENPEPCLDWYIMDADGGLIDLSAPDGADFTALFPLVQYGYGYEIIDWTDNDGDHELSEGDEIVMVNKATSMYYRYIVERTAVTIKLAMQPFPATDDYVWATDSWDLDGGAMEYCGLPGRATATFYGDYDGYGHANWVGNFTLTYPWSSVDSITANYADGSSAVLTESVDYVAHVGDQLVELLNPVDLQVINEHWVDGVNNTLNGWPLIGYTATSIQSVYVKFPNGTERYAYNNGFEMGPPGEWWYEPAYPCELEGYWALGYFPGGWPAGTEWWINYTAATYLTIDYSCPPDPEPYYMEYPGTIDDFYAIQAAPDGTSWQEAYPDYNTMWQINDTDSVNIGNILSMVSGATLRDFEVTGIAIDIEVCKKRAVQDIDPAGEYYLDPVIVDIAAYPHPERAYAPWCGRAYSFPLPNEVENAMYTACYKVLGRQIDLFLCNYPEGVNGIGPNVPGDMFWPQKEVCLCAHVTYNLWPEQQKDVAFQVIDPYGDTYTILCDRTDEDGYAQACFRLPWMCDDPEYYFGTWNVIATVDVACEHINDTMHFKYDYKVHIWKVTIDPTTYNHGECFKVTIDYGSNAMQEYSILLAVTGLDETGVPFDFTFVVVTVGGAEWCTYANGTISVWLCIPKWARAGRATIEVNALDGFPAAGGVQEFPAVYTYISINAA